MPGLSNDLLREKMMKDFLTAMKVDLTGVEVSSTAGLFAFNFKEKKQSEQFSRQLSSILQQEGASKVEASLNLSKIIDNEIALADCADAKNLEIHRAACKGVLEVIKAQGTDFKFLPESGEIELTLPNPVYASLFNLLRYPNIRFTIDGKLVINVKTYLQDQASGLVKIEGLNTTQLPIVLLDAKALESKRMFYATKKLADGTVEVTPYFVVPQATTPPDYHFVLDVSGSMDGTPIGSNKTSLAMLKTSVKKLVKEIFEFQPDAKVSITTFSKGVRSLGVYSKAYLAKLNSDIDGLKVIGDTPLYEASSDVIEQAISSPGQKNVLLFSDGGESGSKTGSEDKLRKMVTALESEPLKIARTKFFVFSYGTDQTQLMKQVTKTFLSEVVNTTSPDFMAAQNDPEVLKRWAAARELFTSRVVVEDSAGEKTESSNSMIFDMSGQLAALTPRICKPGETVSISIKDGNNKEIVQSTTKIAVPKSDIMFTDIISSIGLNASASASAGAAAGRNEEKDDWKAMSLHAS
jgi:hypothetical protein